MRLRTALGFALVALATSATAAHAAFAPLPPEAGPDYVTTTGNLAAGPQLTGEGVFFATIGRTHVRLHDAHAFDSDRQLMSHPIRENHFDEWGEYASSAATLAASAERLAYTEALEYGNSRYQRSLSKAYLYVGAAGGRLARTAQCATTRFPQRASAALDVDGQRVASVDCEGAIVIRDYGGGKEPTVRTIVPSGTGSVIELALAGDHLAFTGYGGTTRVYNWVLGADVYAAPRFNDFDLAADGTLVDAKPDGKGACEAGRLTWYSPTQPIEHVLPVTPCAKDVRIAGDRIAVVLPGTGTERTLALVRLDGSRTDVARLGTDRMLRGAVDYDGARVAFALPDCVGGTDLYTESATEPKLRDEPASCPVNVGTRRAKLGPTERGVFLFVGCPRDCLGRATVTARVGGKRRTIASRRVRPGSCGFDFFEFRLSRAARAAVRSRGALGARVTVTSRDRDGAARVARGKLRIVAAEQDAVSVPGECTV